MRALVCHRPCDWNELVVEEVPDPPMVEGGVRIAVAYASVSFAMSLQVAGKYQRTYPMPFSPGTEVAGTVLEVAPRVTQVRPGDRVLAMIDWGGVAEQVVTRAHTVYPLPEGSASALPFVPAIHLCNAYGTSYGAVIWRGAVEAGQTVLVLGAAGAVGVAAVQIARHLGARVIGVASSEAKRRFVAEQGAHVVLGYENLRDEVMAATANEGVDLVIDPVGGDAFDASLRTVRPFGRIITVGYASGRIPQIPANLLLVKNIAVLGLNMGLFFGWGLSDERARHETRVRAMMRDLMDWSIAGAIRPHVSHIFELEDYREAMRVIRARESTGKVCIRLGDAT